jgi:asparagine N-glycosylation enzyme membrane subunit Stt3
VTITARFSARRIELAAVLLIAAAAFLVRSLPMWDVVFTPDGVRFVSTDAWYFARLASNAAANFPHLLTHDPFLLHPDGDAVPAAPFFHFLIAAIAWVAGLGAPSKALVETVAALVPPLFASLAVVATWFLVRAAGWRGGLLAAAVVAFVPSEFMIRSCLGNTDQHVAEVLFMTSMLAFLAAALRREAQGRTWKAPVLGGALSLAAYLLVWRSSVLLLVVLAASLALALTGSARLFATRIAVTMLAGTAVFVSALSAAWPGAGTSALLVLICAGALLVIDAGTRLVRRNPVAAVLVAIAAMLAGSAALYFAAPDYFDARIRDIHRLMPRTEGMLVEEAAPLAWSPHGLATYIEHFGAAGVFALAGLALLLVDAWRRRRDIDLILALWSLAIFALTLAQVRFDYYLTVFIALLSARVWTQLELPSGRSWMAGGTPSSAFGTFSPAEAGEKGLDGGVGWRFSSSPTTGATLTPERRRVAALILAVIVVLPSITRSWGRVRLSSPPPPAWIEALDWMRTNTPEPFGDPDAIDALRIARPSAYGVVAWWDFGYWLIYLGHRVPLTNPTQSGAAAVARMLLADEESAASAMAKTGAPYAIIDDSLPFFRDMMKRSIERGAFLPAVATWAGMPPSRFVAQLEIGDSGRLASAFFPDYFRAIGVRLPVFGERSVEATDIRVITLAPPRAAGRPARIAATRSFQRYSDAVAFAAADPETRRIASFDAMRSCVPLEPVRHLTRVFASRHAAPSVPGQGAVQVWKVRR